MTATLTELTPADAARLIARGARLIDVREPDEHARERIEGAANMPLTGLVALPPGEAVIFHCRSGLRTAMNAAQLQTAAAGECYLLAGGIEGWRKAGLPTLREAGRPLEIMRQVQIATGSLVLIGVLFGLLVTPAFFALAAFIGAGLVFAGASGWCGLAKLLALMPWNRRAAE